MSDVAVAVESSAPPTDNRNFEPSSYTPEQYSAFMETGKVPDVKADSSSAKKAEVVAPESATGSQQDEEFKDLGTAGQKRLRELAAKVKELEAKAAQPVVKAESTPVKAAKAAPMPEYGEKGHESETFGEFEARKLEHVVQTALTKDREDRAKERQEADTAAANKAIEDEWQGRVDATAAELRMTREEFAAVVFIKELPISKAMDEFIADSEIGPKALHYLATHLDEAKAIASMPAWKAARALIKIEQSLSSTAPPEDKKTPVVPITRAAKPATDLKAVQAAPVDELRAAIEAGDDKRFNEIQDRMLIEKRKRG